MARKFIYDNREFPDPDPSLPVEEVRKQLSEYFPELANADTREEKKGEDTHYVFSKRIGTKGVTGAAGASVARGEPAGAPAPRPVRAAAGTRRTRRRSPEYRAADLVRILRRVPEQRLRLFDLVGELLDRRGRLDRGRAAARQPEVNMAIAEAQAYARATERAVGALAGLPAR